MSTQNRWLQLKESNPDHAQWYIERFRTMAADGADLGGEARLVDAMLARNSRVLDAGCGPGRVGAILHDLGHQVVGVDLDPELIEAAEQDHPGPTWLVGDLATLDLPSLGIVEPFDVIVAAGNVMPFLDPATRRAVLDRLRRHLAADGRLVVGFGAERDYRLEDFFADAESAELQVDVRLATWDLRPYDASADFLVAVFSRAD